MDLKLNNLTAELPLKLYREVLSKNLEHKVNDNVLNTVSNMIALYYFGNIKLKENYSNQVYIEICVKRLHIYLVNKLIEDYSFAISLTLFAVAIAEPQTYNEDITNNLAQANDIVVSLLTEMLSKDRKVDSKELKDKIISLLGNEGNTEDKVQFILDNKDKIISNEQVNYKNVTAFDQYKDNKSEQKNTNRLLGSSLIVGVSTFIASTFLGPIAVVAVLPMAYFGLNLGGKIVDQAERLLNKDKFDKLRVSDDQDLNNFSKLLHNKIQKAQQREETREAKANVSVQVALEQIKQGGIDDIIGTLNQAKSAEGTSKTMVNNIATHQSKKGERGL
ncbi:MAG: hypothetical protein K0R02_347 [Rickettsiaceae bacterium]|jgi:hypothetical protein|nr:hypothetical protein [Rickettsiaceae bacterium]